MELKGKNTERLNFDIESELYKRFCIRAAEGGIKKSDLIRKMMEEYLDENEKEEK